MSEHIESGGWWARTLRPTPRKRLGAAAVALALVAVTAGVWLSPSVAVTATSTATAKEIRLAAENEKLRNSLEARENEVESLERSQAKAAAERKAAAESGKAKAAAEQAAAEADGAQKAEAERAAADARSQAKAAAEKAAADAKGKAKSAAVRAEQAEADAARARARAAAANAPKAPSEPAPAVKPYAPSLDSIITTRDRLFGLFTPQAPFSWAETDSVAARIGAQPTATGYFQGWDAPFRADAVTRSWQKGTLPMLTWESRPMLAGNDEAEDPAYALPAIIGGAYDDYLRQYARDVAALGLPIAIRLDHEMNGSWYPWAEKNLAGTSNNGNRPGDFVAMWRHVHDIFEAEGANAHVLWVWSPNIVNTMPAWQKDGTYLSSLYPGDEYVDWVGLSGYYRPPFKEDQTPTFSYTYDRSLNQLRSITSKPIYLAEIGASETGGNKAAWVADLFTALAKPENADIRGFAWFNHAVTTISNGQRITNDWRIESREDSLAAFVAGLNNPSAGFTPTTTLTSLEP